jgi:hypothetical protein
MHLFFLLLLCAAVFCSCSDYSTKEACMNNCLCAWFEEARAGSCGFTCETNNSYETCSRSTEFKCNVLNFSLGLFWIGVVLAMLGLIGLILFGAFWCFILVAFWVIVGASLLFLKSGRACRVVIIGMVCSTVIIAVCSVIIFCTITFGPMFIGVL